MQRDLVMLVPGFLGFSRFGGFYYFADRLIAVLRGLLESQLGRSVPVVPATTLPTDSLRNRQRALLENLAATVAQLPHLERIHLLGHSTGGVDVQLLACTTAVDGARWDDDANRVRDKVASVTTVAAPHYGTGLADTRLAKFGENPLRDPTAIVPGPKTAVDILRILPGGFAALAGLQVAAPNDVIRFIWQVVQNRDLIRDLRPQRMERLREDIKADPRIPLTCFVTGAVPRADAARPSDPLYRDLYRLTAGSGSVSTTVSECSAALSTFVDNHPDLVIHSATSVLPVVTPTLNDGVVNTVRQIVDPKRPEQIGGFVIGDHGDVLGHHDRQDALIEGTPYNAGLFHSGAAFGDDQFFSLYRRIAEKILHAIPVSSATLKPRALPRAVAVKSSRAIRRRATA